VRRNILESSESAQARHVPGSFDSQKEYERRTKVVEKDMIRCKKMEGESAVLVLPVLMF
jgi:hypothetical protein